MNYKSNIRLGIILYTLFLYVHVACNIAELFTRALSHYTKMEYGFAAECYESVLQQNPHLISVWYNYGLCCHHRGLFEDAHNAFKNVYAKDSNHAGVRSKLRLHSLRSQHWDEARAYGLSDYWWYDEDVTNKRFFFTCKQCGIGDIIQFLRYPKRLHEAGAYVCLQAPCYMHPMLSGCTFIDKLVDPHTVCEADYTLAISTPELTLTMRDELNRPSSDVPYLKVDKSLRKKWASIFSLDQTFKIGLCWRSSMMHDPSTGKLLPSPRSIPLSALAPLSAHASCSFYSLQVGHGVEELENPPFSIHTFDSTFDRMHGSFKDTMAVMELLDLVITVDTSIAHIAGALGVPVCVILPVCSDFRWFLNTDLSPWYPSMRLFRQQLYGDWDAPIKELNAYIGRLVE